jgi:hypothetical protein
MTDENEQSIPSRGSVGEVLAKGIADIIRIATEPDWIPVSERLPVDIPHGYCLVTDGTEVGTANYSKESGNWDHCIDRDYWKPTHWMPLPAPPAGLGSDAGK